MDFEEFLLDGRAAGWSPRTIKNYRWHLARLVAWLAERGAIEPRAITRRLLREWSASLRDKWQPATCKQGITTARSWLQWLRAEGCDVPDPDVLKTPVVPLHVQRTLSAGELAELLETGSQPTEHGLTATDAATIAARNVALVSLLFDSLLRASELCALEVSDVDLDAGVLIVRHGKGGGDRRALFSEATGARLRAWLAVRPSMAINRAVFVGIGGNTPGEPLTPRGLRIIVKHVGERAGIAGVSPHSFRRGGATEASLNGMPDRILQELGGWSSLTEVQRYTRSLSTSPRVIEAHRQWGPLAHAGHAGRAA